jgi:hypothetical protein
VTETLALLIIALLLLTGCTPKPKPQHIPPPPAAEPVKPVVRHIKPGPNDRPVYHCTPTKWNKDSVDCVCLNASTTIDSVSGEQSFECRPSPKPTKKEARSAKH